MKILFTGLKKMSTQTWMKMVGLVICMSFLSVGVGNYLKISNLVMIPWSIFVLFTIGVVFIIGAVRREFFQYKIIRGPTAVVLNILMVVFTWGLAIALLISWLTKR